MNLDEGTKVISIAITDHEEESEEEPAGGEEPAGTPESSPEE